MKSGYDLSKDISSGYINMAQGNDNTRDIIHDHILSLSKKVQYLPASDLKEIVIKSKATLSCLTPTHKDYIYAEEDDFIKSAISILKDLIALDGKNVIKLR